MDILLIHLIFVTGGTRFIGSAVVQELVRAGHQVTGLARSDESAQALTASGAKSYRGNIDDLDSLRAGVADAVIHLAFNHDFSNFVGNCLADGPIIRALGDALKGSNRTLVVTSVFTGETSNPWSAVHRLDAALLYRLVVENAWSCPRSR
ncbi:hypothetical protein AC1031_018916 [Aphanomyces cochlioides]|nr:hypothetical protein AC1031_018916 [Aphanomyces cochlioides]